MPVYTSNFSELLEPGLREIYGLEYSQYPEEYSKVFNIETSSKAFEEDLNMSGFGLIPTKSQGSGVTYDTAYQGWTNRYTHATYGMGFMVTREMYEDDLYRKMKLLPRALARSVRQSIETMAANVLNRAFSGSYTGGDGKELCATDHVLIAGSTYSNELATAADFDVTSYEQALIDIQAFVDDRGLKMAARPKMLVGPPNLDWQFQMVLKSEKTPDNANNAYNPAKGTIPYTIMHWLTDTDAWFILTDVPNGLNYFWRRRPEFTNDSDFDSENAKYKTTYRCSVGWTDPRGIFGSPGA